MEHAYGRRYDSTWHAEGRMTTPLLRCAPWATLQKRCHGMKGERLRRGAGIGSPFSFLAQGAQKPGIHLARARSYLVR
jgi:hypothetical protein